MRVKPEDVSHGINMKAHRSRPPSVCRQKPRELGRSGTRRPEDRRPQDAGGFDRYHIVSTDDVSNEMRRVELNGVAVKVL
jgi:hypothetical protein